MRWAVITSLVIHSAVMVMVFRTSNGKSNAYPKVIPVHLTSMPVTKGVEKPTVAAESKTKPSKAQKIEEPKNQPRMAEVNKKKKPAKAKKETPKPAPETTEESKTAAETQNQGLPQGVELGSEFGSARLDAVGFDSPYFLNVLFSKIRNGWDNPYEGADSIECVIYFVVGRRGKIIDSAIEKSSGLPVYDQSALRAVLAAKPPPLPNQFNSDELGIHLEFKYIPYN